MFNFSYDPDEDYANESDEQRILRELGFGLVESAEQQYTGERDD